jgi:hypothetical protein
MTDFPTVGLGVDLTDLDKAIPKLDQAAASFDKVGVAAGGAAKNVKTATSSQVSDENSVAAAAESRSKRVQAATNSQLRQEQLAAAERKRMLQEQIAAMDAFDRVQQAQAARTAVPTSNSAIGQMAEQIKAVETADRAAAAAATVRTAAQSTLNTALKSGVVTQAEVISGVDKIAAAYAKQNNVTLEAARAILNSSSAFKGMAPPLKEAEKALGDVAKGAGAVSKGIGLSSLQIREFAVIARELSRGDMTRLTGSASILAGSFGLVTESLLVTVAVAAAAIAPFALLFAAFAAGSAEAAKLSNALTVTNGAVGMTAEGVEGLAKSIATDLNYSQGKAIDLLTKLAATGKVTADSIGLVATASIKLSELTGEASDKIAGRLLGALDDASKAAAELNQQYHFLTLAQYDQIEALQKAGDAQGAFTLLMKDLNAGIDGAQVKMGIFETAIHNVATAFDGAWQSAKNLYKQLDGTATTQTLLDNAKATLNEYTDASKHNQTDPQVQNTITLARSKIAALTPLAALAQTGAQQQGGASQTQTAGIAAERRLTSQDTALGGSKDQAFMEAQAYGNSVSEALAANPKDARALDDADHMADRVAAIYKKYDKLDTTHHRTPGNPFEGALDNLSKLQAKFKDLQDQTANLSADDPLATWAAQIKEAGDTASASLRSGDKKNLALADQTKNAAELVKQQELLLAMDKEMVTQTQRITDATASQTSALDAQLKSQEIMHDYLGQAVTDTDGYVDALKRSKDAIMDQQIAEASLAIARSHGVSDISQVGAHVAASMTAPGTTDLDRFAAGDQAQSDANAQLAAQTANIKAVRAGNDALTARQDILDGITTEYSKLNEQMTATENLTKSFGDDMANAFGKVGKALQTLLNDMDDYIRKTSDVGEAQKIYNADGTAENLQKLTVAQNEQRESQVKFYGDMISSAQSFFKTNTVGYKVLGDAEKAYRLYEFAMSAKAIVVKTVETAAKVGLFSTQATAAASAGAAEMFASLGPLGFAAVAAMAAVLVGFGVKGIGGGGNVPGANDAADRQAAQGAGTVLGDASAKSSSISKALEITQQYQNADLEYGSEMVSSLRSIDSQIGVLASAVAKTLGIGGALSTTGLGLGSTSLSRGLAISGLGAAGGGLAGGLLGGLAGGSVIGGALGAFGAGSIGGGLAGGLVGAGSLLGPAGALLGAIIGPLLFGGKQIKTLQDQGLTFNSQNLGSLVSGGVSGSTYQQVATETKKSFVGLTYSDKTKSSTTDQALDADLAKQITDVIGSLRGTLLNAATSLGIEGAQATLDSFNVDLGTLSLKDLSGDEITDALNNMFSKLGDEMAQTLVPAITSLQQVGEGAFETLARLEREYQVVDVTLQSMGKTFDMVGVSSLAARDYLVQASGGLDQFTSQAQFFTQHFLTDAEQLAPIQASVSAALGALGYSNIQTRDQFKDLVESLDLTTKAGADTYATLMNIAPAFDKVAAAQEQAAQATSDAANTALSNAQSAAESAIQSQVSSLQTLASTAQSAATQFQGFIDSLKTFRDSLATGDLSGNSLAVSYRAAKQQFASTAALAATGDPTALGGLQASSETFLQASQANSPTLLAYQRDLATVKQALDAASAAAKTQVDVNQKQLDALNTQISQLNQLLTSVQGTTAAVLSVGDAINNLAAAQAAVDKLNGVTPAANDNGAGGPTFTAAQLNQYYGTGLGGTADKTSPTYAIRDQVATATLAAYYANQLDPDSGTYKTLKAAGFASGGYHTGGLRIVGEKGPELEATGSSRIWNAKDTSSMLSGGSDAVVAAIEETNSKLDAMATTQRGMAKDLGALEDMVLRVTENGTNMLTAPADQAAA